MQKSSPESPIPFLITAVLIASACAFVYLVSSVAREVFLSEATMLSIGVAHQAEEQGDLVNAEKIFRDALKLTKDEKNKNYPNRLRTLDFFSKFLRKQGKVIEAESLEKMAVQLREH